MSISRFSQQHVLWRLLANTTERVKLGSRVVPRYPVIPAERKIGVKPEGPMAVWKRQLNVCTLSASDGIPASRNCLARRAEFLFKLDPKALDEDVTAYGGIRFLVR
jgi:hypothetical protein